MIDFISGKIIHKNPARAVVENNGIGYNLHISVQTFADLPNDGEFIRLFTYLHVREESMQLFAFSTEKERLVFNALISVAGVGPKLAQTILSGMQTTDLIRAIRDADLNTLVSISGVGRKTAQRLVVELTEKLTQLGLLEKTGEEMQMPFQPTQTEKEAILALMSLGYKRPAIEKALSQVRQNGNPESVEELIKNVLRVI
jgi:Holliday junction DNA helicase RuvA